jgi:hypothetical protein
MCHTGVRNAIVKEFLKLSCLVSKKMSELSPATAREIER